MSATALSTAGGRSARCFFHLSQDIPHSMLILHLSSTRCRISRITGETNFPKPRLACANGRLLSKFMLCGIFITASAFSLPCLLQKRTHGHGLHALCLRGSGRMVLFLIRGPRPALHIKNYTWVSFWFGDCTVSCQTFL